DYYCCSYRNGNTWLF
nr:immunoglobulin light chain junction region [Macaca mulatta]MOV69790.1 immunoglobulin light chain junction region [Macaca mulatta]